MSQSQASGTVRSADGTQIAFDRTGVGPSIILVEPSAHYRDFSAFRGLVPLLAQEFTVCTYDRRGRGESTDAAAYAPAREVEDIEALVAECGGSAYVYGFSSGALLALRAVAHGLAIPRLAVLEPPLRDHDAESPDPLTTELAALVVAGRNGEAVERFHQSIGVPEEMLAEMRGTPQWAKMVSIAHTLVYDCVISDSTTSALLRSVKVPTLVLDSAGSTDDLKGWAATIAGQLPHGSHRSLAGEWHGVPDDILALALVQFFQE